MRSLRFPAALFTVVALVGLVVATSGCPRGESPHALAEQLATAKTASAEAELFERIHRHRRGGLSLVPIDNEGRTMQVSEPDWWKRAHRVIITLDGERMDHVLLEPNNVFILMGE